MADYKIALSFEDGVTRFIKCKDTQSIANAAYQQRINIPVDCNDGACGTCKSFVDSGEFDKGDFVEDALSPDEEAEGYCLTCQAKPKSDMVVEIASTSDVAKTAAATYEATITGVNRLSKTVVQLKCTIPNRDDLAYLPGQYVNIEVPGGGGETRSYSFANDPASEELEFLVKLVPGGLCSSWLDEKAKAGDKFKFTGPHGSFFLREALNPVLMVAGGTGLAPILSMLRTVQTKGSSRPVHVVYGANTDEDAVELDTLQAFADELPNVSWNYCIVDENTKCANVGFVQTIIDEEHLHSGDASVYLCGPPPMVEAVRQHVKGMGLEPNGFYYEKFTSAVPGKGTDVDTTGVSEEAAAEAMQKAPAKTVAPTSFAGARALHEAGDEARALLGDDIFGAPEMEGLQAGAGGLLDDESVRLVLSDLVFGEPGAADPIDADRAIAPEQAERTLLGDEIFPLDTEIVSVGGTEPAGIAAQFVPQEETGDRYEIGEEHPDIQKSDALFSAREALELGALELVIGRIENRQISGYRMLAEATLPYIEGDRFLDPQGFIESNAAFHDYLFTLTNNEHLLQAYHRLGVKGSMEERLKNAHWCHPLIAKDHLDMVDAVESGDRERARELFRAHADRSKQTMRRAMQDSSSQPMGFHPGRFTNKVVVITGAAQGIGEAVAKRIHNEGGTLVLADRSDLVEGVADKLSQTGAKAVSALADMETYAGAKSVVDAAIQQFGRIDVAIHVVGGTIWRKPFEEYAEDEIIKEINRSLYPTLWACRAVLPELYKNGKGTIVNVSSVATTGLNRLPYAAAKGGVNALTRSLAWEAAEHGVRVVATAPGGTEAPPRKIPRGGEPQNAQEEAWHQVTVDQTIDSAYLQRYGTLDEQAAAICFMASDEAAYITGTVLPVAGGDLG